jgi:hypothetical protein
MLDTSWDSLLLMCSVKRRSRKAGRHAVKIINLIPIPICWGLMGAVFFGLVDALTGGLFGRFMDGTWEPVLASAIQGVLLGYLAGWYAVSRFGLPRSATLPDLAALGKATRRNAPRP